MPKVTSGQQFRPGAVEWNSFVDAAEDYKRRRLSIGSKPTAFPVPSDIVKLKNSSGADRVRGEILKIDYESLLLNDVTPQALWMDGIAPDEDIFYFGILRNALPQDEIGEAQVGGVCFALVDINDTSHLRAYPADNQFNLQSGDGGPLQILYHPGSTGEQECIVSFGEVSIGYVAWIGGTAITARTGTPPSTVTPGSGTVTLYRFNGTNLVEVLDANSNPVTKTCRNWAAAASPTSVFAKVAYDGFGTLWLDNVECP